MSDIFGLRLTFHVFTSDGDLYVSDRADGDRALRSLVTQYPDATVIPEGRGTGHALGEELPLIRLLQDERGFLMLKGAPPTAADTERTA